MFPAPAGMSPHTCSRQQYPVYVPRTCGDEPTVSPFIRLS